MYEIEEAWKKSKTSPPPHLFPSARSLSHEVVEGSTVLRFGDDGRILWSSRRRPAAFGLSDEEQRGLEGLWQRRRRGRLEDVDADPSTANEA